MGEFFNIKKSKGRKFKLSADKPFKIATSLIGVVMGLTLLSAAQKSL